MDSNDEALLLAAETGVLAAVTVFLEAGANIDASDPVRGTRCASRPAPGTSQSWGCSSIGAPIPR